MEQEAKRIKDSIPVVKSYWISRKEKREKKEVELDVQALGTLKEACEFYNKNYPKSNYGISYDKDKEKLSKASFEINREAALAFRDVLEYYKTENTISIGDEKNIGRALWRVNQRIPDLSRINKIIELEEKKKEMEKEIHRLRTLKEEVKLNIETEKELHFVCGWCEKEFIGDTARFEIKEHILKCPKMPNKPEEPPKEEKVPEKLYTCNICEIELNRYDMKDHAMKGGCIATKEVKIEKVEFYICEECGKECKTSAGLKSHFKTHKKEE